MTPDRVVTLKIDGDLAKGGRVPLELLAEKLRSLQELVLGAAQVVRPVFPKKKKGERVAQSRPKAADACRLFFRDARKNCLTLEAELPETTALFPEYVDWGAQSVDRAAAILWAVKARDENNLRSLVPQASRRLNILKHANHLTPKSDNYTLSLTTANQFIDLDRQVDDYIKHLELECEKEKLSDIRTLSGEIYKIDTEAGNAGRIGIKTNKCHIMCDLNPSLREQLAICSPGLIVEVTGKAELTKTRSVHKITDVTHLRIFGSEPMTWTRIFSGDREFVFNYPIIVDVKYDNYGWIFSSDEFGIVGYSELRRDAYQTFQEDFIACWDNIACAEDSELSDDAIELKIKLLSLVKNPGRQQ